MYSRVYLYIGRYPPPPEGITFIFVVAISVEKKGKNTGKILRNKNEENC
jgi:hypothetical protein